MINRFDASQKDNGLSKGTKILLVAAIVFLFVMGVNKFLNSNYLDDGAALREAVKRDMIHCYSVEGFYPPSIEYMEEHYGLSYDRDKFEIEYKVIGGSVMPEYSVKERADS